MFFTTHLCGCWVKKGTSNQEKLGIICKGGDLIMCDVLYMQSVPGHMYQLARGSIRLFSAFMYVMLAAGLVRLRFQSVSLP